MPARTGRSTYIPGVGTTTRGKSGKAKTFAGKGPAPAGTKKVAEKSYDEVPTVTVTDQGTTTSGFKSPRAARRAARAQRTAKRKALLVAKQTRYEPSEAPKAAKKYKAPQTSAQPNPLAKPKTFQGKKTAGTPTRKELKRAAKAGTLKVNRKGFATTPRIRKVGGELRRLRTKGRSSNAPLPGLGPRESRNARTVIRRGEKKRATRKEKLAAITTGLVEAPDFKNPAGGDADSEGWRQERTSIYGTGPQGPRNVKASADRFFDEVRTDLGTSTAPTPGLLAQAAQGSAYPERYDARLPEAKAILKAYNKGSLKPAQRKKLAAVTKEARALGLKSAGKGVAPRKVVKRFKAIGFYAKKLEQGEVPYVYGGGHETGTPKSPAAGLDCSSSTVWVLNKAGVKIPNIVSGDFGNYLPPGPGAVTVFYNPGHVFMKIGNRYFGTSASNPKSGPGFIEGGYSADYLSQYNVAHVPGLGKKQAVQMGIDLSGAQSFPGMTVSGTTATINPGAATTQQKPGFSKKPIKLTPMQKYTQTTKQLREVGVGGETETTSAVLDELAKKYAVA